MTDEAATVMPTDAAHCGTPIVHVEPVMGTVVSFRVVPQPGAAAHDVEACLTHACTILHRADEIFSTWVPRSPMNLVRGGELRVDHAPREIGEVLELCAVARRLSQGWFDPWAMPGGCDPTGLVKGWAADRALDTLRAPFVAAALVNAGGDIAAFGIPGDEPWQIGVRHPWRPEALACILPVSGAVATSGPYERGEHLIDPWTGDRRARAASATVTGPTLATADALATALAVGGARVLDAIASVPDYEGYLIAPDGSESWSDGMAFAS